MKKVTKKDLNERLLLVETLLGLHRTLPEQISNEQANNAIFRMQCALSSGKDLAEPKPQLKQLDQSVFDGLDAKWRFAAVPADGKALYFSKRPHDSNDITGHFIFIGDYKASLCGEGYDTTNWQNSLIERDIAKELLEVDLSSELTGSDLCRKMLARGDKCVLIRMGVRDDKQAKELGRFAIATSIDESGRFNVMSDQQPISKVDFATPINNQGEPLTQAEAGL